MLYIKGIYSFLGKVEVELSFMVSASFLQPYALPFCRFPAAI
jgi:hypothetical protein